MEYQGTPSWTTTKEKGEVKITLNRRRGAKPFEQFLVERLSDGNEWTDYEPVESIT